MDKKPTASVCVVTHNNASCIEKMLKSVYSYSDSENVIVYVVDNNSSDNTVDIAAEKFPQAIIVKNSDNKGFGHGHNTVLDKITSDYHFIVNPDIIIKDNIISEIMSYMEENRDITMLVPKFIYEDGREQFTPKKQPTLRYMLGGRLESLGGCFKRWRDEYTMRNENVTETVDVGFCSGCFIAVRTDVFKKVGGFDERYFLYSEDADITRMAKMYGRTVYAPQFSVVHLWERAYMKKCKFFFIQISSMIKYFYKWRNNGRYVKKRND